MDGAGYDVRGWLEYLGLDGIAGTSNEGSCSMDELRAIMMIRREEPIPESLENLLLRTRASRVAKYGSNAKSAIHPEKGTVYVESTPVVDTGRASSGSRAASSTGRRDEYNTYANDNDPSYEEEERMTMTRARRRRL